MEIPRRGEAAGFTLIELSIVLVIIGLIVGGVLTGQDLIKAAEVRATISQIEKYNTAVNTFYGKYGALPGDLNQTTASQFGFASRGTNRGQGDGNGVIEGYDANGLTEVAGETVMFWVDLTTANGLNLNMIDGTFSTASATNPITVSGTGLSTFFPQAKLGRGNYIWVTSGGSYLDSTYSAAIWNDGHNYFTISALTNNSVSTSSTIPVQQAYSIDKKMDDGFPMTGNVIAGLVVSATNPSYFGNADTTSTCINSSTPAGAYSLSAAANGGAGPNCALEFRFQ